MSRLLFGAGVSSDSSDAAMQVFMTLPPEVGIEVNALSATSGVPAGEVFLRALMHGLAHMHFKAECLGATRVISGQVEPLPEHFRDAILTTTACEVFKPLEQL